MPLKLSRVVALAGVAFGLFLFGFMASVDLGDRYSYGLMSNSVFAFIFRHLSVQTISGRPLSGMGPSGFVGLCLAVVSFIALRRHKGIGRAIREGTTLFGAPSLLVFEFGLWYMSKVSFAMSDHVTNFVPWAIDGVYLLSNSHVLLIALALFLYGICRETCVRYYVTPAEREYFIIMSALIVGLTFLVVLVAMTSPPHGYPPVTVW